jgi:hypothetical protein
MMIGITLALEDGQKARIRFAETPAGGAHVVCEASKRCVHDLSREHIALIFQAIGVPLASTPLDSVQAVVAAEKAEELFHALHTSPALLENPQFAVVPETWEDHHTTELLELYLTGFTLEMLSGHFQIGVKQIVRKLAHAVWGEETLTEDRTKARYQQTWHRDETNFLLSQLQLCKSPAKIAALMDRDSFGIAFKAFQSLPVPIPQDVQERFALRSRTEPLGSVPLDGKPF